MLHYTKIRIGRILIYLSLLFLGLVQTSSANSYLKGQVLDSIGEPIIGVTVVVLASNRILSGTATNSDGWYSLKIASEWPEHIALRFSSIGYHRRDILSVSVNDSTKMRIVLKSTIQQIKGFQISPEYKSSGDSYQILKKQIGSNARTSLVPTNLAGSIKSPGVSRAGSSHSALLRIHGTSPMYYYNNLPLGYDPNHYGMFTVLPSPSVSKITYATLGTGAEFGLPAVINLTGERRYKKHHNGSFQISTLDATANYSIGTGSQFLSASIRKSVLDKLVDRFSMRSEKRTLPPTNFQDIVVAGGNKFSPGFRIRFDAFHTRDYLAYNTKLNASSTRISTRQHTERHLVGIHLDHLHRGGVITASLAVTDNLSEYYASPNNGQAMFVDLSDQFNTYMGQIKSDIIIGESQLSFGTQAEIRNNRKVRLEQYNWNFLSPFSNSDNPYVYQQALNENYDDFDYYGNSKKIATYASYQFPIKSLTFKGGLRWEKYSKLANQQALCFRGRLTIPFLNGTSEIFAGSFNESPINNILEPYQIQILANLKQLKLINKRLISFSHTRPRLKFAAFHKEIENLPTLTPHFYRVFNKDGTIQQDFITVESNGKMNLWGATIEFDIANLVVSGLNGTISYGYSDAYKQAEGITAPYELEAPHTLLVNLDRHLSSKLVFGIKYAYRSGYPYTPAMTPASSTSEIYNEAYYSRALGFTNSERFSPHASLDLFGHFQTGLMKIFWSISNLTNRSNPIISSRSGYIYDSGILPTIGLNFTF